MNKETLNELKDPQLLLNIVREVHKRGVCANELLIIGVCIVTSLRWCKNYTPTSSNLLVSAKTGTGKDKTVKETLNVLALKEVDYFHRTGLSDKVFRYWDKPSSNVPSWDSVIVYLEDPEEDLIKGQTFKTIASGANETTVVKEQSIIHIKIQGKPIFIVTSAKSTTDDEGSRRWCNVPTDTSEQLNKVIQEKKIDILLNKDNYKQNKQLTLSLINDMKSYEVFIPDIELIKDFLSHTTENNTMIETLIDYIKGCTLLYQYQRKIVDGKLISTVDDVILGAFVFLALHMNGCSYLEDSVISLLAKEIKPMFKREILERYNVTNSSGLSEYRLNKLLNTLIEKGKIAHIQEYDEKSNRHLPKFFVKNLGTDFSTATARSLSEEKRLITEQQEGSLVIKLIEEIREERTKLGLDNSIYLILQNRLITKLPSCFRFLSRFLSEEKNLITEISESDVNYDF